MRNSKVVLFICTAFLLSAYPAFSQTFSLFSPDEIKGLSIKPDMATGSTTTVKVTLLQDSYSRKNAVFFTDEKTGLESQRVYVSKVISYDWNMAALQNTLIDKSVENYASVPCETPAYKVSSTPINADIWNDIANWAKNNKYRGLDGASENNTRGGYVQTSSIQMMVFCNALNQQNKKPPVYYYKGKVLTDASAKKYDPKEFSVKKIDGSYRIATLAQIDYSSLRDKSNLFIAPEPVFLESYGYIILRNVGKETTGADIGPHSDGFSFYVVIEN